VCRRRLPALPSLHSATAAAFTVRPCTCSCLVPACNAFHAEPFGFVTSVKVAFQVVPSFPSYIVGLHYLNCADGRCHRPQSFASYADGRLQPRCDDRPSRPTMSVCKIHCRPSHKSFIISSSSTPSSHAVSIASPEGPCLFCCRFRFSMNSLVRVSR
jgi:hypothetical protein